MKEPYRELNFSVHRVKIKIEGFRIDKLFNKALEKRAGSDGISESFQRWKQNVGLPPMSLRY